MPWTPRRRPRGGVPTTGRGPGANSPPPRLLGGPPAPAAAPSPSPEGAFTPAQLPATTNEELQSTNEELETMNAELQSTNEELQTINDELRMRTGELDEANDFLESLLVSQRGGLVVIDRELRISVWNDHSAELWGVRTDEAPGQ